MTAILNSKLINHYHKYRFLDLEKDLFQKILIASCKKFPIKKPTLIQQQPFVKKTNVMLGLNEELQKLIFSLLNFLQNRFSLEKTTKKLEAWHELSYQEFLAEIKKQNKKITLTEEKELGDLFLAEQLKATNLVNQIEATDQKIDAMVYQLYELTEEEINLVEQG